MVAQGTPVPLPTGPPRTPMACPSPRGWASDLEHLSIDGTRGRTRRINEYSCRLTTKVIPIASRMENSVVIKPPLKNTPSSSLDLHGSRQRIGWAQGQAQPAHDRVVWCYQRRPVMTVSQALHAVLALRLLKRWRHRGELGADFASDFFRSREPRWPSCILRGLPCTGRRVAL